MVGFFIFFKILFNFSDHPAMFDIKEEPEDMDAVDFLEVEMENEDEIPGTSQEILLHDVTSQTDLNKQDAGEIPYLTFLSYSKRTY